MRLAHGMSGSFCIPAEQSADQESSSCMQGIDECAIDPGVVFDSHSHRNIEILTYIVDGILDYRDNDGNRQLLMGGEVQLVGAGSGITHSESNASHSEPLHVVQAWFGPDPAARDKRYYRQRYFSDEEKRDKLCLIASGDERDGSLGVGSDIDVYAAVLRRPEPVLHQRRENRRVWIQMARGVVTVNDLVLGAGDAAAISGDDDRALSLNPQEEVEFLLFDLP